MINLFAATQSAVFRALQAVQRDDELTSILGQQCRVYTHTPQNTQPPFLKIGQLSSESEAEGYDQVERINIEIYGVWRGQGNTPLLAMLHAARSLLDGQVLESDRANIQPPYFLTAEIGDAANGDTYVGMMNFEMMVEPAQPEDD